MDFLGVAPPVEARPGPSADGSSPGPALMPLAVAGFPLQSPTRGAGYTCARAFYMPEMWFMFMFITPAILGTPYLQSFMKILLQKTTPSR